MNNYIMKSTDKSFNKYSSSFEVSKQIYEDQGKEVPDYIKMSLMQKDKRIMEYTTKLNESSSTISKLNQSIAHKEREQQQMKAVIQNLSNQLDIKNKEINSSQSIVDTIKEESKDSNEALKYKVKKLTNQLNELSTKSTQYQLEAEELLNRSNMLQMTISNKERELTEQKVVIRKYEEMIKAITKDNQQIGALNQERSESKEIIDKLIKQDQKNKEQIAYLLNEIESLNNFIQSYIDNYQKEKGAYENQILSLDAQCIDISNQLKQKTSEEATEKKKRKSIAKELDQLISYIVNQSSLILLSIDDESKHLIDDNNSSLSSSLLSSSRGLDWLNDSKYDFLKGNLIKINAKLNDSKHKIGFQYKMMQKNIDGLTRENKELLSKIEAQRKAEAFDKTIIEDFKKQMSKFEVFNENYNSLKIKYLKLSSDYEELVANNQKESSDNACFLQKLCGKFNKEEVIGASSESILKSVDELNEDYNQLKSEIELKESEIANHKKEKAKMTKEYNEKVTELSEQIALINSKAKIDINKVKDISSNQIKQLTILLGESKLMLLNYQKDYDTLLEEKSKLDYRLQRKEEAEAKGE